MKHVTIISNEFADLYQAELEGALDDLTDDASDLRAQGPEVHQAVWDGFESTVSS